MPSNLELRAASTEARTSRVSIWSSSFAIAVFFASVVVSQKHLNFAYLDAMMSANSSSRCR